MTRALILGCALLAHCAPAPAAGPIDSIVKVHAKFRFPNVYRPWAKSRAIPLTGTGVVIEGNKILTNAHLVHYGEDVEVQFRPGQPKYPAKVEGIALDMDLAVLSLKNNVFFKKHPPLPKARQLPKVQERVTVHGFPIGGEAISVTRGVISRIEHAEYGGNGFGLRIQVSAQVNPGNSGGPALVDGKMVGLVFGKGWGEGVGYVIPNPEIDLFLDDLKDGKYEGKAQIAYRFSWQRITNPILREKLGLKEDVTGVMVPPGGIIDPGGALKALDVITHVGPFKIDNDGMVPAPNGMGRIPFKRIVHKIAKDGTVPLKMIRNGKTLTTPERVSTDDKRLLREFRGESMSYFLYGPLVFAPARADALAIYQRMNPAMALLKSPLETRILDRQRFPGEELVVVTLPMFEHKCVKGYDDAGGLVVQQVNGQKIKNLKHLVEVLRDAKEEHVTIHFAELGTGVMVLRTLDMEKVTQMVMQDNGVPANRRMSPDLIETWNKAK